MDARSWTPPLPPVLLVVLFALAWLAFVEVLRRAAHEPAGADGAHDSAAVAHAPTTEHTAQTDGTVVFAAPCDRG